jgi:hypothetical protein
MKQQIAKPQTVDKVIYIIIERETRFHAITAEPFQKTTEVPGEVFVYNLSPG